MMAVTLRSRFRGTLIGALVGDCLGAYWETQSWQGIHPIEDVKRRFAEQIRQTQSKKAPVITYTDDTALTFAIADSLIECGKFDANHMARRYPDLQWLNRRQIIAMPVCSHHHAFMLVWWDSPFTREQGSGVVPIPELFPRSQECGPIRSLHFTFNLMGLSPACMLTNRMLDLSTFTNLLGLSPVCTLANQVLYLRSISISVA